MNITNPKDLENMRKGIQDRKDPNKTVITICGGTGCKASGADNLIEAFKEEIQKQNLQDKVDVRSTGCHGFCEKGPIVVIYPSKIFYPKVTPEIAPRIVTETVVNNKVIEEFLYVDPITGEKITHEDDVPFYLRQDRIILASNGLIDPTSIEDYIGLNGYSALAKVLTGMGPEEVIDEVKASGLRGRGGAGFPTGLKWSFCRNAKGEQKYIICNADEGDPGAYMDRSVLEGNPHSVIEGMIIGAYAIGASKGYVYVRGEYPLAVHNLDVALKQAEELGLLGENILGTEFNFDLKIYKGAGAFVCGEESALIASIEGRQGEPRQRPPFPAQSGLWGAPTNINNVETWANVSHIINKGADWYASIGTEGSKGSKIFSLVGKINNTGLVEVPIGTPLRKIVYDIGGGIPENRKFKAVQTGGPSGGCIPNEHLDTPVDYEELTKIGSIMGSGGLIVMDEDTCMVDIARYFINFTADESCGKCSSCREGSQRMLEILTDVTEGLGKIEDLKLLVELSDHIKSTSMCALGQTLPNPVLSTMKYFMNEYEDHILHEKCTASVCSSLFDAPCQNTCPAETNVPGYIQLIKEGRYFEAYDLNREVNPLTAVCGRVCPHPCQARCKRGEYDESLNIVTLKRGIADYVFEHRDEYQPNIKKLDDTGKKIAIIGGGPAGLSAAYFLRRLGHSPTIYEAEEKLGGMLVWGIPSYRLPRDVIEQEIQDILNLGVEVKLNTRIGQDINFDQLKSENDAVLISVGATRELKLDIENEDAEGVFTSLDMLKKVEDGKFEVGKMVAVIGGGNAAIDAARTAKRFGAEVTIVYRREKKDMPAFEEEIEAAEEEDIKIILCAAPKRIITDGTKITGLECLQMELGEFDRSGRRRPQPVDGSEFTLDVDMVIVSIGQQPDTDFVPESTDLERRRNGTISAHKWEMSTNVDNVFAAGDAVLGPSTVIESIAQGYKAAITIDEKLMGESRASQIKTDISYEMVLPEPAEEKEAKTCPMTMDAEERCNNFTEVVKGFTIEQMQHEASRCLRCDIKEEPEEDMGTSEPDDAGGEDQGGTE